MGKGGIGMDLSFFIIAGNGKRQTKYKEVYWRGKNGDKIFGTLNSKSMKWEFKNIPFGIYDLIVDGVLLTAYSKRMIGTEQEVFLHLISKLNPIPTLIKNISLN